MVATAIYSVIMVLWKETAFIIIIIIYYQGVINWTIVNQLG